MSTPMLKQYHEIKSRYPDVVLFYRMGDFFELFYEDAKLGSEVLGLTLTKRGHGKDGDVPLAGFPHHQLENYLAKMTRAGYRVAVCEQVEDPKKAKGVVKRAVTEVVSAGTTFSSSVLDESKNNYLAAVMLEEDQAGLAYADVTTGEFFTGVLKTSELAARLGALDPSEILCVNDQQEQVEKLPSHKAAVTVLPGWQFSGEAADKTLTAHYGVASLKGFGLMKLDLAARCAGALLGYVNTNLVDKDNLLPDLQVFHLSGELLMDDTTRRNLELVESLSGSPNSTLLSVLNRTRTGPGSRLLRRWLLSPLTDLKQILERQSRVAFLFERPGLAAKLSEVLSGSGDLQRLLSKLRASRATPRDAVSVRRVLERLPEIGRLFESENTPEFEQLLNDLEPQTDLVDFLKRVLVDDPPVTVGDGRTIRYGYSDEFDELRQTGKNARQWILEHQAQQRETTGIPSLKIGYNKVFGYYIEITNTHKEKVPSTYIRKQTLTNAERYVTPELKAWEEKILSADEKIARLEQEIWERVRQEVLSHGDRLRKVAGALAETDATLSLAVVAREREYVRPELSDSHQLKITGGRHPVVESLIPAGAGFTPNDVVIGRDDFQVMVLTGPNMSGKSTYLRQAALIVLMAQTGSFVPAKSAGIGIVDRIFTRIGAGDNVAGGESTFLVEMTEVSNILRNATQRSLVILDEVGRGTSTYDGLSLAWAVTEYLHENFPVSPKTLFATHYHELNRMADQYDRIQNYRVEVEEWGDRVVFLHKIVKGETDRSYGIEVARLAGLPPSVIERARQLLPTWEAQNSHHEPPKVAPRTDSHLQLTLFESSTQKVADALLALDLDTLTPREAQAKLYEIKSLLSKTMGVSSVKKP